MKQCYNLSKWIIFFMSFDCPDVLGAVLFHNSTNVTKLILGHAKGTLSNTCFCVYGIRELEHLLSIV